MDRAIGYIRVSTEEQSASGLGLESQHERIAAYARFRQLALDGIATDAGVSAGVPFADRPGGAEVLAAIGGGVTAVVVLKLDRAFRDTVDALQTIRAWDKQDIALHVLDLAGAAVDTRTANGRLMLTVRAGFDEFERHQIRERTAAALERKRARGQKTGGSVPFGYTLAADGRTLEPCPDEQRTARRIARMRKRGKSLREIAARLNRGGVRTKGGAEWKAVQVKRVLANVGRFQTVGA